MMNSFLNDSATTERGAKSAAAQTVAARAVGAPGWMNFATALLVVATVVTVGAQIIVDLAR